MRPIHTLPLAAAIALAACGGANDAEEGALTGEEIAAEAQGMIQPRAGQYRAKVELLEFDAPGMPDEAKQQMQQIFARGLTEDDNLFCMTEQDVAQNGAEQMVKNLAESDCVMNSFEVAGGSIVADMQCAGTGGGPGKVHMEGQMTAESSTMTMDMDQEMPNVGALKMKMRVNSQRIGECPA